MLTANIVGGSGYVGGELLRLLVRHPTLRIGQVTSQRYAGKFVHSVHPNLRGWSTLKFEPLENLHESDVLFICLPHGKAAARFNEFADKAATLVDLSADFRLNRAESYEKWYGQPHPCPDQLSNFVYGLPETQREALRGAKYCSGVGCNATATNLALKPLADAALIQSAVVEVKVGSSEGGASFSLATHHPERSGAMRSFAPTGHRHQAEILQELGEFDLHFSATAVEMVRGVLCTAHVFLSRELNETEIWKLYRQAYGGEPFIRIVKERSGIHRLPDPKLVSGTNICDVGFQRDTSSNRVVVISAIDNLVKGAAGSAIQSANLMLGFDETSGLDLVGLHPL